MSAITPFTSLSDTELLAAIAGFFIDEETMEPRSIGGGDYVLIRDQKAAGVSGGTFTALAWRTRDLNTEVVDAANRASLDLNRITLVAGTYRVRIRAPALFTNRHQAKLRDITNGADLLVGTSAYASNTGGGSTDSLIVGRITVGAGVELEVQHRCEINSGTFGFGAEANFGLVEVYTVAEFWKE